MSTEDDLSTNSPMNSLAQCIWDVWIVLDKREIRGRPDRQYFERSLVQNGCKCIARNLVLGDFLWVARKRIRSNNDINNSSLVLQSNYLDNNDDSNEEENENRIESIDNTVESPEDEIVLDYIVERKCMDDLIASIKDGRFRDQKLRLKSCGLKNKIYIVEEARIMKRQNMNNFGPDRIRTALSQTIIHHGFFVKQTSSIEDTVAYLTQITRLLDLKIKKLSSSIHPIPLSSLTKSTMISVRNEMENNLRLTDSSALCLPTFEAFQVLNWRTKDYTIRDVWIRQLVTINGVSLDKAIHISHVYPTFKSLMDAYFKCKTDDEKANLLINTVSGHGRRAITQKLSKKFAEFFCEPDKYPLIEQQ